MDAKPERALPSRTENWKDRIIFVPDSKTPAGRRMIPMIDRVHELLRIRAGGKSRGWLFPSKRSKCGHLTDTANQFRLARAKAGLPENFKRAQASPKKLRTMT